jgi:hypothetical protein
VAYGSGYAGGYDTVAIDRFVEIEFDAGVWTDVTEDVVAITTRRGRNKESGAFETGVMTFSLRNDDRTYDPDHASGPYYGKLRPNRRVRFRANYLFDYSIFQGYIDRISQVYGGPNDATAEIQVSDLFKLMNRVDLPGSAYAAEALEDTPTHWWRLGEASGSTVLVDAGSSPVAGTPSGVTLGEAGAPVRDPDGAAGFDGIDDYISFGSAYVTGYPYSVELWLKIPERTTTGNDVFMIQNRSGTISSANPAGWITGTDLGSPGYLNFDGTVSLNRVDDDAWHHVVLTASAAGAGNQTLWIDGVSQGTGTPTAPAGNELLIGYPGTSSGPISNHYFEGSIDEIAIYPTVLNLTRVSAHNEAGRTPWDGELSGARLVRIADLAGIGSSDRDIDAGSTTLQATSLGGSALAYAQKVEETEAGRLFVGANGKLMFLSRHNAETGSYLISQATLVDDDSGAGRPYRSVSAEVDEATIVTRATVSRDGSVAVTYQDSAAITEFGIIDETHEGLLHDTDSYSESYAQFVVNTHKTPTTRIGAVEVALHKDPTNMYPDILGLELGDRVTYKRKPQNTGAVFSQDMRVEAIEHQLERLTWNTRLQLSPFSLTPGPLWVLDTVGASELGQTTYLGF